MFVTFSGTVKWFDSRPEKRFGFITPDGGGKDIFFHLNDYRPPVVDSADSFGFMGTAIRQAQTPKIGDRVAFMPYPAAKGPKAFPWTYEEAITRAQEAYAATPNYRIVKKFGMVSDGSQTPPHVMWEGKNLRTPGMEMHYNPYYDRQGGENGDITWETIWEVSRDGGKTWAECPCPPEYKNQFTGRGKRQI